MREISIHLDWLRYTVNRHDWSEDDNQVREALPSYPLFDLTSESVHVGQGYDSGLKLRSGMVFWHSVQSKQGISVQLSGMDLQAARDYPISELALLMAVEERKGRVSTLHSCINVHGTGASPVDILTAHSDGTLKTRARHIGVYSSSTKGKQRWDTGDTVYIGSPKSAIQIRVYNKAAEQHIDGDWIRIEIVFRGRYAHWAFKAMLKYGIPAVTRSAIQKQVNLSAGWWAFAMRGGISPPMQVRRKEGGTSTWLKNVVLPALENAIDAERKTGSDSLYELYAAFVARKKP
jgi:hypothetical protein